MAELRGGDGSSPGAASKEQEKAAEDSGVVGRSRPAAPGDGRTPAKLPRSVVLPSYVRAALSPLSLLDNSSTTPRRRRYLVTDVYYESTVDHCRTQLSI